MGLPVHNGERYVADALSSILGQTWRDLEVVVCDNASTDATREICEGFAARDPRVRYYRNERNLGASPNWNRTFELSRGELFKWAAHDDVLCPTYIERALAALDAEPDAVLCQSLIVYIDHRGRRLGLYDSGLGEAAAPRCSTRFATLALRSHTCTELYGLIRRSALRGSLLHGNYHGGDRALLGQLALRGRFIQVREPLLHIRDHQTRYTRTIVRPRERSTWHDASQSGRLSMPTLQPLSRLSAQHRPGRRPAARAAALLRSARALVAAQLELGPGRHRRARPSWRPASWSMPTASSRRCSARRPATTLRPRPRRARRRTWTRTTICRSSFTDPVAGSWR